MLVGEAGNGNFDLDSCLAGQSIVAFMNGRSSMDHPKNARPFLFRNGEVFSHTYWFNATGSVMLVLGFSLWAYFGEYTWLARGLLLGVAMLGLCSLLFDPHHLRIDRRERTITYYWIFGLRKRTFAMSAIEKIEIFEEDKGTRICFKFREEKKPRTIGQSFVLGDEWDILSDVLMATDYPDSERTWKDENQARDSGR